MELSKNKFDEGRILKRARVSVKPTLNFRQLQEKLGTLGADLAMSALSDLDSALASAVAQSSFLEQPSKAPKLPPNACDLDFDTMPAAEVWREGAGLLLSSSPNLQVCGRAKIFGEDRGVFASFGNHICRLRGDCRMQRLVNFPTTATLSLHRHRACPRAYRLGWKRPARHHSCRRLEAAAAKVTGPTACGLQSRIKGC
jgi:hypothetical protein